MADGFHDGHDGFDGTFNLCRFIGQTVTIFTSSGGATGCGFTGVLMSSTDCFVRLLTKVGAAPDCAIGSTCCCPCECPGYDYGNGKNCGYGLGSVVIIPTDQIVSFVHNAV